MFGRKGQGLVEYILIIALVAILVIAALKFFGKTVKKSYGKAAERIEEEVTGGLEEGRKKKW